MGENHPNKINAERHYKSFSREQFIFSNGLMDGFSGALFDSFRNKLTNL